MTTAASQNKIAAPSLLPKHIAIIMDGNNRWAKQNLLPRLSGHKAAKKAVNTVIRKCKELGIPFLTLFAFSSENWNRPHKEVSGLMSLLYYSLKRETKSLVQNGIRLKVIGDTSRLSIRIQKEIQRVESKTIHCHKMQLCIALNYGGQWDITHACKKLAHKVKLGIINPEDITEHLIEENLATQNAPPVDLLIRTSGEQRISNFLLWQCAYSEFYFSPVLWPDFDSSHLETAIQVYKKRERRFGKISEQLHSH